MTTACLTQYTRHSLSPNSLGNYVACNHILLGVGLTQGIKI